MTKKLEKIISDWERGAEKQLNLLRAYKEQVRKEIKTREGFKELNKRTPNKMWSRGGWYGMCAFKDLCDYDNLKEN